MHKPFTEEREMVNNLAQMLNSTSIQRNAIRIMKCFKLQIFCFLVCLFVCFLRVNDNYSTMHREPCEFGVQAVASLFLLCYKTPVLCAPHAQHTRYPTCTNHGELVNCKGLKREPERTPQGIRGSLEWE